MSLDFSIESGVFGDRLVLKGVWHDELIDYMLSHKIVEINVNYARGFVGSNLDFLQSLPFLEGLDLLVYSIPDISVIHALHRLRSLRMACRDKTPLDFAQFPVLEECSLDWRSKSLSIFECATLKKLSLRQYTAKDTELFRNLIELEELSLNGGPLNDLTGLRWQHKLRKLGLYRLPSLSSLQGIEELDKLEILNIDTCRKLISISEVENLSKLQRLQLTNCGDVDSLHPLEGLSQLEELYFYESTNILDGDISPLNNLPKLGTLSYKNRKHYSQAVEDFVPFNASSKS